MGAPCRSALRARACPCVAEARRRSPYRRIVPTAVNVLYGFVSCSFFFQICARYCAEAEPTATYFGVEYSYECFCGDDSSDKTGYRKHTELDDDECRYFCTDGSGDYCGGFEAIEVSRCIPSWHLSWLGVSEGGRGSRTI